MKPSSLSVDVVHKLMLVLFCRFRWSHCSCSNHTIGGTVIHRCGRCKSANVVPLSGEGDSHCVNNNRAAMNGTVTLMCEWCNRVNVGPLPGYLDGHSVDTIILPQ